MSKERLPNLGTIIMVEKLLKKSSSPLSISQMKEKLPKKVMHQTLKSLLVYLWESKKINYTPNGIQWIFEERK